MVRLTRASSKNDPEDSTEDIGIDVTKKGPPPSDASYARKFVIAKEGSVAGSRLFLVRHPKNRTPCLYRLSADHCDEIVAIGDSYRCWFYGDGIVSDGVIRLFSPVHPLFLALPYFMSTKKSFMEIDEIIRDPDFPAIALLLQNKQFLGNVDKICDCKEVCDTKVFRFSENKALEWIAGRFRRLRGALIEEGSIHKAIVANNDVLDRYSFGMLCDYINAELAALAKSHLSIQDASTDDDERSDMSMKRKADDMYEAVEQKPVKKPKESAVAKQLQQASKGTKSISNFFSKK